MAPQPPRDPRYPHLYGDEAPESGTGQPMRFSANTRFGQAQQTPTMPSVAPMSSGGAVAPQLPTARDPEADLRDRQIAEDSRLSRLMDRAFYGQNPAMYDMNTNAPEGYVFDPQVNDYVLESPPATELLDMYLGPGWEDPEATGWTAERAAMSKEGSILADIIVGGFTPEEAIDRFIDNSNMVRQTDPDTGIPTGEAVIVDEATGEPVDWFSEQDMYRISEIAEDALVELGEYRDALNEPRPQTEWEQRGFTDPAVRYVPEDFYNESTVRQLEAADRAAEESALRQEIMARAAQDYMENPGLAMSDALARGTVGEDAGQVAALNYRPGDFRQGGNMRGMSTWDPETGAIGEAVSVDGGQFVPREQIAMEAAMRGNPDMAIGSRQAQAEAVRRQNQAIAADQRAQMAAEFAAAQGQTPFNDQMRARQAMERAMLGY